MDASVEASAPSATLPAGKIAIFASLQLGLSSEDVGGGVGSPIAIAPDVWYGVNDKLQVGAVTSWYGMTGFWSGTFGTGLCVSGEENGCPNVFDNLGAEAHYSVVADGAFSMSAGGGLHAVQFSDPFQLALKAGVRGMYRTGKIGIGFAPNLFVGLTERDLGNKEILFVPVDVNFQATPELTVGLQSGIWGPLDGFGDAYFVPVAIGAAYMINPQMSILGAFAFDRLTGGTPEGADGPGAADLRSLNITFAYMM